MRNTNTISLLIISMAVARACQRRRRRPSRSHQCCHRDCRRRREHPRRFHMCGRRR